MDSDEFETESGMPPEPSGMAESAEVSGPAEAPETIGMSEPPEAPEAIGMSEPPETTKNGRKLVLGIVAGVAVLVVLACLVGVAIILPALTGSSEEEIERPLVTPKKSQATEAPSEVAPKREEVVESYEVYEYKDPFRPTYVSTASASGAGGAGATGSGSSGTRTTSSGTRPEYISLKGIEDSGSERVAVVEYGGKIYKVAEGERVGGSPYQVLGISSTAATMLYGDDRMTVAVGQRLDK